MRLDENKLIVPKKTKEMVVMMNWLYEYINVVSIQDVFFMSLRIYSVCEWVEICFEPFLMTKKTFQMKNLQTVQANIKKARALHINRGGTPHHDWVPLFRNIRNLVICCKKFPRMDVFSAICRKLESVHFDFRGIRWNKLV